MARAIHKLKFRQVETLRKVGRHSDGGGLYLKITPDGSKRWVFMYARVGRQREMGLGSAQLGGVSLPDARQTAQTAREDLAAGQDPLEARAVRLQAAAQAQARTFGEVADEHIQAMASQWKNAKHKDQWTYTLEVLAKPLRPLRVNQIDTAEILEVLKPLWKTTPETASRLRGRIEAVLDRAKAKGERQGENPARWRGHLKLLLPKRQKLTRGHHPALPYDQMAGFMEKLRAVSGLSARALEFCILTATRSTETLAARWDEVDLDKRVWTVPAIRMKATEDHRVPLSLPAVAVLKALRDASAGPFLFPSAPKSRKKRPSKKPPTPYLSNMSMTMCLRRIGYADFTTHGFRSSFRDWASEVTSFPHEVCEKALAHKIKNESEAAYRRGDMLAKRAKLMEAWAQYCEPKKDGKVIPLATRVSNAKA